MGHTNSEKKRIVLLRHGESQWNRDNRLTGWTDIDLTGNGMEEAYHAADFFIKNGFHFDKAYTSFLKRANHTLKIILEDCGQTDIEVERSWRLNENHYGRLQGLYRSQVEEIYGSTSAGLWLASYNSPPPALSEDDIRNPRKDEMYKDVPREQLPLAESYEDLSKRVIPYWEDSIVRSLKDCDTILVVAHGNSLREILKHLYNIPERELFKINLHSADPVVIGFEAEYASKKGCTSGWDTTFNNIGLV